MAARHKYTRNGKAKSEREKVAKLWKTYITESLHADLEAILKKLGTKELKKMPGILESIYQYQGRLAASNAAADAAKRKRVEEMAKREERRWEQKKD